MTDNNTRTKSYNRLKTISFFCQFIFTFIFFSLFYFSGASLFLSQFAQKISANNIVIILIYLGILSGIMFFINMVFSYFEDYLLEKKFSLFTGKVSTWFSDFLKGFVINLIISLIVVELLYLFLRISVYWWIYIWAAYLFLSLILAKIYPYVILPLFFKFTVLNNPELEEKVKILADYFKIKIDKSWVVDFSRKTKKANAFVSGLGSTKRVAFADNLINNYSSSEIEAVIAHEFSHVKNKDTLKQIFLIGLGSFLVFFLLKLAIGAIAQTWTIEIYNISTLPLFAMFLYIFMFLWMPLQNLFLRAIEKKADIDALSAIKSSEGFISLMERLAKDNLAEIDPPKWKKIIFYSHPPIKERIELARSKGKDT